MKSKRKKKILAAILCMVMVLTNNFSILAEGTEVPNEIIQPETPEQINESETEVIPEESKEEMPESEVTPQKPETEEMPQEEATPEEPKVEEVPQEEATPEKPKTEEVPQTEETPKELKYEDEQVSVVVTAVEEGAIPAGATLKVLPITLENNETKAQYEDVEKRIQEKVAEEEKEVAGFLAYDITFVDGEGNEIEPNSKVKVSMNYKNAVLPNDVKEKESENVEVSVFHLEEDENGNVKDVVDMGAEQKATVNTLATAEGAKVQNVEMETESFSVFTIVWKDVEGVLKPQATLHFVNERGEDISGALKVKHTDLEVSGAGSYNLNTLGIKYSGEVENGYYVFSEAHLDKYNSDLIADEISYNAGDKNGYDWHYFYKGQWRGWKKNSLGLNRKVNVYLVYEIDNSKLSTVETVDAGSKGVTMKMIDLGRHENKQETLTNGRNIVDFGEGSGYGEGTIKKGLLQSHITNRDGFPTVINDKKSLGRLFSGAKKVDNLFLKNIYDDSGYFEYSSFDNYAYLNGNSFTVYNQIGTPSDNNSYFYKRGNFMPYNKIENGKFSSNRNQYDEDGKELPSNDSRYNERLYRTQGANNYYFGMMVEAEFTQQRNGQATHQKPNGESVTSDMIYEFNGDDDLWVFIDDVLVLDIGGIHDAHSGSINFRTGEVAWYDCRRNEKPQRNHTNLKEIFKKEGILPSGKKWTSEGAQTEFRGDTFADYTTEHSFKMYYFERGGSASNLHIKFNLPTVPTNTINVQKIVQDANGQDVNYAKDIDFLFEIEVDGKKYVKQPYDIVVGNQVVDTGMTDENAQFTLKHNQTARFKNIEEDKNYRVKELGAYLDGYEVWLDGTTIWTPSDGTKIPQADSGQLNVAEKSTVVFINKMVRSSTLNIKKELAEGTDETDKEFQIELKLGDELYKGTYTIGNTTVTAVNGIIKLKAGQTATITGLPYGVKFEARELMDGVYLPAYGITEEGVENIQLPGFDANGNPNGITSASAQINGAECTLTVTNAKIPVGDGTTSVFVKKNWENMDGIPIPEHVDVYLYKDVNQNGIFDEGTDISMNYEPIRLNEENGWSGKWENLPGDTDYVVKEVYPAGYKQTGIKSDKSIDSIKQVGGRNTPNNGSVYPIGVNNLLLVKETGNKYFLWSPIDLKLDKDDISYIADEIKKLGLEDSENLDLANLSYCYGVDDFKDISLERVDNGWKLSFNGKSAWAMFWTFQYHRTQNITLTNSLDKDALTSIRVEKKWEGDNLDERPESVTVQLYKNGEAVEDALVVLNDKNHWKHTFEGLPVYTLNGNEVIKNVYTVKETKIGDEHVDENGSAQGYQSSVTERIDDDGIVTFVITNKKGWQIVKVSESSNDITLAGAVFKLSKDEFPVYGISDNEGVIKWYEDMEGKKPYTNILENGVYTFEEIKAPEGYVKSTEKWTIKIENGYPTITKQNGLVLPQETLEPVMKDGKYTYYFKNTPLYELPEAGGKGTFVYTIGGTLLLMAATLLLYKMKRGEVLKS